MGTGSASAHKKQGKSKAPDRRDSIEARIQRQRSLDLAIRRDTELQIAGRRSAESKTIGVSEKRLRQEG